MPTKRKPQFQCIPVCLPVIAVLCILSFNTANAALPQSFVPPSSVAAPDVQFAEARAKSPKHGRPKKRAMKQAGKRKSCGIELGNQLQALKKEFPVFINRLAAIKKVVPNMRRRGPRFVVAVDVPAKTVRRDYARLHRAAHNTIDIDVYHRKALAAANLYIKDYIKALRLLGKHGYFEKPRQIVGGKQHTTMRQSLNALLAWRRGLKRRLEYARRLKQLATQCPPKRRTASRNLAGIWFSKLNKTKMKLLINQKGRTISGTFINSSEPNTSMKGSLFGNKVVFNRLNVRRKAGYTQSYTGRQYIIRGNLWLIGVFTDSRRGSKKFVWCATKSGTIKSKCPSPPKNR